MSTYLISRCAHANVPPRLSPRDSLYGVLDVGAVGYPLDPDLIMDVGL
jgi:hypothetical protein